jgi:hypothetical protein
MIAVLLDSRKEGSTCWAAVRGSQEIRLTGLGEKDILEIQLAGNGSEGISFFGRGEDCRFKLPDGVEKVKVHHLKASGSPVYVDLF